MPLSYRSYLITHKTGYCCRCMISTARARRWFCYENALAVTHSNYPRTATLTWIQYLIESRAVSSAIFWSNSPRHILSPLSSSFFSRSFYTVRNLGPNHYRDRQKFCFDFPQPSWFPRQILLLACLFLFLLIYLYVLPDTAKAPSCCPCRQL